MNLWLKLAAARRIAAKLQVKYCGASDGFNDEVYVKMCFDLLAHPEYHKDMWLQIHWDMFDCVCWVQIGIYDQLVPR